MTDKELADKYEKDGWIDIAWDMDADELKQVISALRRPEAANSEVAELTKMLEDISMAFCSLPPYKKASNVQLAVNRWVNYRNDRASPQKPSDVTEFVEPTGPQPFPFKDKP